MEDSQSVPNPLFQCNYFYASRELLSMTATTGRRRRRRRWRRDETRRDETRRDETRRDETRRDGDIACVGPAERRHWFQRGRDAKRQVEPGLVRVAPAHPLARVTTLAAKDRSGIRDGWEKVGELTRDERGWDKDRCHWQHLGELETDKRKLTRDWNTWRADRNCAPSSLDERDVA